MARKPPKAAASAAANLDPPAGAASAVGGDATPVVSQAGVSEDGASSGGSVEAVAASTENDTQQQSQGEADLAPPAEVTASAGDFTEPAAEDQAMVEITARSTSGKPFRRCGIAWTGEFQTERVSLEDAVRIATDPSLKVKPLNEEKVS